MTPNETHDAGPTPEFSIVTVSLNNVTTISDTVRTVANQVGVSVEHIIKDGGSIDGTVDFARTTNIRIRVKVSQDNGIYDAMNQGFKICHGKFVGFLNADDYYSQPNVLAEVKKCFDETGCDIVYGDIKIVDDKGRVLRHWVGDGAKRGSLQGKQLPHPAVFVLREHIEKLDQPFDPSYRISADLKQQLLLIETKQLWAEHLPLTITIMRTGGKSSANPAAIFRGLAESARAYREVHNTWGWGFVFRKSLSKLGHVRFIRKSNPGEPT